jgi:amidase
VASVVNDFANCTVAHFGFLPFSNAAVPFAFRARSSLDLLRNFVAKVFAAKMSLGLAKNQPQITGALMPIDRRLSEQELKSNSKRSSEFSSRRTFLRAGVTATAAVAAYPALGSGRVSASAAAADRFAAGKETDKDFELDEVTIDDVQRSFQSGQYSSRSLTEKYLQRIREIDQDGPRVNSVIDLNPDALQIAGALDEERRLKGSRGPMHGIPILIKDNIDTGDRMRTTAGSLALLESASGSGEGSQPANDAFVAAQLRKAGAVILGKTNLSEWANIRSSHSTSGWSGRGGLTRNPYALDRNPCGSSSGTGAGVSANFCVAGVGTETDGSVVCPTSANGLAGLKPTVGLVSRRGIIPISHSQDTAGPMARTVRDIAILLGAMVGADADDSATAESHGKRFTDYTKFLDPVGLKGARLGVVRKYFGFNDAVDRLMETLLGEMKYAGAEIVDPADIPTIGKFDESELTVFMYELKADLAAYLARRPGAAVKSLKDVIAFNELNRDREMPYFGQDLFIKSEEKGPLTSKEYLDALALNRQLSRVEGIDFVVDKWKLDALVAPTAGPAWITDLINGDRITGGSSSAAAVAGYPNINVTAGYLWGLPVGISFFGRAWSEPTLLRIAYSFEQMTKARQKPRFLPTLPMTDLRSS